MLEVQSEQLANSTDAANNTGAANNTNNAANNTNNAANSTDGDAGVKDGATAVAPEESLYRMKPVDEQAKQAVDNISTLTSFKSTIMARTAVYDTPEGVLQSLRFYRRRFKWFDFDESDLEKTTTYYCCDEQGMHNVHLTGHLIICHKVRGKYIFRSCVAEFYEQVTFDQLAYKVLASSTSIAGGIAASAITGAGLAWPTDAFTWGTGSIVGGIAGAIVGVVGAVFVNVDADSKEKQIEKKLGSSLYNASTNRINSHGIMEMLLLHYLLADQKYNIDGTDVRITGVQEQDFPTAGMGGGTTGGGGGGGGGGTTAL
ncbi:unnamed protein product [Ectocarpus sp. CCAP 1310/34]|nr:unnamed protein product [Ectocarpus sp. CCAP 1310/34]